MLGTEDNLFLLRWSFGWVLFGKLGSFSWIVVQGGEILVPGGIVLTLKEINSSAPSEAYLVRVVLNGWFQVGGYLFQLGIPVFPEFTDQGGFHKLVHGHL